MIWTEAAIAQHLEGVFVTVDRFTGHIVERIVPDDYLPDYSPEAEKKFRERCGGWGGQNHRPFSPSDDAMLIELRSQKKTWSKIGRAMKRARVIVTDRYKHLCKEGIVTPPPTKQAAYKTWEDAFKARIVRMRKKDLAMREIAKRLGVSTVQVRAFFKDCHPGLVARRDGQRAKGRSQVSEGLTPVIHNVAVPTHTDK